MVPTSVAGIPFVASFACMCSAPAGTFGAAVVVVLHDIHCSLAVGAATAAVVGLDATVAASAAGADSFAVSLVAGAVAAGVATWFMSAAVLSTPLVCPVQIFPSSSASHYPSLSIPCSIWQCFMLRTHACTFVHLGVIYFDIREVDLFFA